MFRFIERLRQKPESVRHTSAILLTVLLFIVIVSTWLVVDTPVYLGGNAATAQEHTQATTRDNPSPFTSFRDALSRASEEFGAAAGELRTLIDVINSSTATSSPPAASATSTPPATTTPQAFSASTSIIRE